MNLSSHLARYYLELAKNGKVADLTAGICGMSDAFSISQMDVQLVIKNIEKSVQFMRTTPMNMDYKVVNSFNFSDQTIKSGSVIEVFYPSICMKRLKFTEFQAEDDGVGQKGGFKMPHLNEMHPYLEANNLYPFLDKFYVAMIYIPLDWVYEYISQWEHWQLGESCGYESSDITSVALKLVFVFAQQTESLVMSTREFEARRDLFFILCRRGNICSSIDCYHIAVYPAKFYQYMKDDVHPNAAIPYSMQLSLCPTSYRCERHKCAQVIYAQHDIQPHEMISISFRNPFVPREPDEVDDHPARLFPKLVHRPPNGDVLWVSPNIEATLVQPYPPSALELECAKKYTELCKIPVGSCPTMVECADAICLTIQKLICMHHNCNGGPDKSEHAKVWPSRMPESILWAFYELGVIMQMVFRTDFTDDSLTYSVMKKAITLFEDTYVPLLKSIDWPSLYIDLWLFVQIWKVENSNDSHGMLDAIQVQASQMCESHFGMTPETFFDRMHDFLPETSFYF